MVFNHQFAWKELEEYFEQKIQMIHCFDISHNSGFNTTASAVAFNSTGPSPSQYRHFNITDITPGDDYAALEQAVNKRYRNMTDQSVTPTIILIDGGTGQLNRVIPEIDRLAENWDIKPLVIGISKGITRKIGSEVFIDAVTGDHLNFQDRGFYYLLIKIRDASHNYANKKRVSKELKSIAINSATLSGDGPKILGLGDAKSKAILQKFNIKQLPELTVSQLMTVEGIGKSLAKKIYDYFHK